MPLIGREGAEVGSSTAWMPMGRASRRQLADVPIPHSLDRNTLATDEQSGRHASLPAAHSDSGISATQLYEYT